MGSAADLLLFARLWVPLGSHNVSGVFLVEDHELPVALFLVLVCPPPEEGPEPEANIFLSVEASLDGENWIAVGDTAGVIFPGATLLFTPESPTMMYRAVVANDGGNVGTEGVVTLRARNARLRNQ